MDKKTGGESPFFQRAYVRVGLLLLTVLIIFGTVRQLSIPPSFGEYGRYRGDSIGENVAKKVNFALGNDDCKKCHLNLFQIISQAEHKGLNCQSCHGPAANHVSNPASGTPKVIGNEELCGSCHRQIAGRTKEMITMVMPLWHSGGVECAKCHNPHQPREAIGGRTI